MLDRVRIARELHDVVAHHVSSMGVQAGAARAVLDQNPDGAKRALTVVEESSRQVIGELRHLLDTLRGGDDDHEDPPSTVTLAALDQLVRASEAAGTPTSLRIIGDPRDVPSLAQVNLYRIAQEALTNARRHAGPNVTADVRLRYSDDDVELEVTNTGRAVLRSRAGARHARHARAGDVDGGVPRGGPARERRLPGARARAAGIAGWNHDRTHRSARR